MYSEDGKVDTSGKYISMCVSAKDIQHHWNFKIEDYIFDPADGEARVWFGYPPAENSDIVWLPRHDQLQEICIQFFMQNLKISEYEAFLRFLEWYSGCLRFAFEHSLKNSDCGFSNSSEEILLNEAMTMMHGKKWDGNNWVKALKGYEIKPGSNLSMER